MENYLTKKNIIIAAVILALILGVLVYLGLKPSSDTGDKTGGGGFFGGLFPGGGGGAEVSPTPTGVASPTPEAAVETPQADKLPLSSDELKKLPVGALIKLTDGAVSSISPQATATVKYHKNIADNLGHLFERKADGTNQEARLSNFTLPQILKVVWSPDGRHAVIFYNIGGELRKLLTDYSDPKTPKTNFLPNSVSDVAFSPDGKSMAFINDLGSTRNIFVATADFKNQKKVMDNEIPDLEISWPAQSTLAVKTKSSYALPGFLYAISVNSGALTKIAEGQGLDAVWNQDASLVLYSTVNQAGAVQNIKFYDVRTGSAKEIKLNTIAEKCIFLKTQKNIGLCAAPRNFNSALKYPDDWWKGKAAFLDSVFSVNAETSEINGIARTNADVVMPKLMPDDSFLLFQDRTTGILWSVKLK